MTQPLGRAPACANCNGTGHGEGDEMYCRVCFGEGVPPTASAPPRTDAPETDIPRRNQMQQWTPGERAIQDAVDVVERMGADVRLTDAVILLGKARDRVADFVDGVAPDSTVYPPIPGGSR